jgi:phosphoribosylaminoimidazolecarboxamide formyltransferase/IMP cyclohydrolase
VKHNNPCGVGTASEVGGAVERAIAADPVSVFGGIIATNRVVDVAAAEAMAKIFLECIVAPGFSPEALERLKKKKDLRLLEWGALASGVGSGGGSKTDLQFRSVTGGYLVQTADEVGEFSLDWRVIGEEPSNEVKRDLMLAWKVCAMLKSNAIAIAFDGRTLGLGMGQVNRVDAVEHAIERAKSHHATVGLGAACLASDAFFPFADSVERAADAGIRWIIQPGGSIRDEEVFAKARERGVNMVLTGRRHFRH